MTTRHEPAPPGSTVFVSGQATRAAEGAAPADVAAADVEVALESLGQWQLAWRRFKRHRMALLGLGFLALMIIMAIVGPIVWPYNPLVIPGVSGANPGGEPPSLVHLMGTDNNGRDVFQMVVNGSRISLIIGIGAMIIAGVVGVAVGTISGYFGGWIDNVLMRIVDTFFAIPLLFVILVAARFFGQGSVIALVIIFGLLSWALVARLLRAQFLSLREVDFVEAARAVGVSDLRIAFRDILPNAIGPVIVVLTLLAASNIVLEAFVSYLGFGISEEQISWGNALAQSQNFLIYGNWWWAFFPGIAIALTVIAINFVGDGMRDALDPRTRL